MREACLQATVTRLRGKQTANQGLIILVVIVVFGGEEVRPASPKRGVHGA